MLLRMRNSVFFGFTLIIVANILFTPAAAYFDLDKFRSETLSRYQWDSVSYHLLSNEIQRLQKIVDDLEGIEFRDACDVILDIYADAATNFSRCIIERSFPEYVCLYCGAEYVNFQRSYAFLKNVKNQVNTEND